MDGASGQIGAQPRRAGRRSRVVGVAASLLGLTIVVIPSGGAGAIPVTPFAVAFTTNDNGAIFTIGNNLLTCPASASTCAAARAGTVTGASSSNNAYSMVNLDADSDPSTFNSSSSDLLLPAGSTVLWAGMFWGARQTGDPRSLDTAAPINQASLRVPGAAGYQTITSTKTYGPTGGGDVAYQQFANVTSLVQAAGNGPYWVGNVAAGLGRDRYAGWSIAVVYRDPTQPLRNLTVFDGFSDIAVNSSEVIPVSGFLTPPSGPVDARVGIMAYEGDRGATGDSAFLNSTRLATAASPGTNFFNSANDLDGRSITTRTPADDNMLGFDIARTGVPGAIPNGATSATVTVSTTSERYYVGWVTTQINLYAPDFTTSRKTSTNLAGRTPAVPGDTIEYTLTYVNTGGDPATNAVATDPFPANTTYVPGSLQILDGPNAGPKTDATGDDQAEVVGSTLTARLGTGANASTGGTIAPGATTTVRFHVTLDAAAAGTTVENRASLDYVAQTVNQPFAYVGNQTADPVTITADLRLTKATTPDPMIAGGTATSTLTATNDGPSAATNVVITDTLDNGITPTGATVPGGTCTINGQVATCTVPTLAAGASVAATVTASAPAGSTLATFSNLATATSDTIDPDQSDNTAGSTVDVVRRADLRITKTANGPSRFPGETVTYTISVTNDGPSIATDVTVNDPLDPRLTAVPLPEPPPVPLPRCVPAGQTVVCTFGTLAPGQTVTDSFDAMIGADAGTGPLLNAATVSSATTDPAAGNDTAIDTLTVAPPQSDVAVTKTGPADAVAGQPGTYTIEVVNNGPSLATGVDLVDSLPVGVTAVGMSSSRGTCDAVTVTCELGSIPVGGTAYVILNVMFGSDMPADPGTSVTNTVQVQSATTDPLVGNNVATASTPLTGSADLSIIKTGAPLAAVAGGTVTYTIDVANAGPSTARAVTVTDFLPDALVFQAVTAPPGASCPTPGPGADLSCTLGDITAGSTQTLTVVMQVPSGFPGGDVANSATVSSPDTPDPDGADNTATFTNTASAAADLSITKTAGPDPLVAGALATWTLTVTNNGPSDAANVTVTDALPAGLATAATATVSPLPAGSCTATAVVNCTLGTVANGASVVITISAQVMPDGSAGPRMVNTATVASDTADPTASNNSSTSSSDVVSRVDLAVTKAPSANPIRSGEVEAFQIVVTNNGPSTATDVKLLDHWDANWEGATGPLCQFVGDDIECDLRDVITGLSVPIPPGDTAGFIMFLYPFDDPGSYINTITVSNSVTETNTANNSFGVPVQVVAPEVDLQLTKDLDGDLVAGEAFAYDLELTNAGPSIAETVTVTDVLPAGLTPTTATVDGGSCTITGQTVTCTVSFLFPPPPPPTPGTDLRRLRITGTADASITGTSAANTATATATGETDPANNTATSEDDILRQADVAVVKTATTQEVVAGGDIVYNISITNAGPSAAPSAVLTDPLPAGVTFDPDLSDPSCTAPAGVVSCSLATVGVGQTVTVAIGGNIDPTFTEPNLLNRATFVSGATPPTPSNETTTTVVQSADLALSKVATGDAIAAGSQVEYTIAVANDGPSAATNVTFDDPIPAGTTLAGIVPTAPLTCTALPCDVGTLLPGETASVVLTLNVPADREPGPLTNTATAGSPTPDPNPGRRTSSAVVEIVRRADISLQKIMRTSPVVAGMPVTYDLVVSNAGPSDARDVTVTDALPAGTAFIEGSLGGPPCEQTDTDGVLTVSCVMPSLAVGQSFTGTLTLSTDASLSGSLANTAVVGAQAIDGDDSGNTSSAVVLVEPPPTTTTPPPTTTPPTAPPTTPPTPPSPPPTAPPTTPDPGQLPATGSAVGGVLIAGGVLLLGGNVVLGLAGRRRRWRR